LDSSTAEFDNGVLTLTLSKAEETKSKTINIKVRKLAPGLTEKQTGRI
jgi:hypothetical protein